MKKLLFLLAICCSAFGLPIQDRKIDSTALAELTAAFDISSDADLVAETQKRWLRKAGQERWEIAELSPSLRAYVLDWATKQGLYEAWKPLYQSYDKALILGATTSRMQMRLGFLKKLYNEGVRFKEIVWLTGDRPLDKRVDELTDVCKNESEAAHILWENGDLPVEMRECKVTFIAVPMKQEKRPNTEDTLVAWLKESPEPCKALFVSDQPFCGYQFAVVKSVLPKQYEFDLVGQGVDPTSHPAAAAITLDSIARWIYQEHKNEIVERYSFREIVEEIKDPEALVFIDIDDTLIDFDLHLGCKEWRKEIKKTKLASDHDPLTYLIAKQIPMIPLEKEMPQLIRQLQQKGHFVFPLTARERDVWYDTPCGQVDALTYQQLLSAGFDFEQTTLPSYFHLMNQDTFYRGIYFSKHPINSETQKGETLKKLLAPVLDCKTKVYFIDDKKQQCESVLAALKELGLDGKVFWYRACEKKHQNFDMASSLIQLEEFLLSNKTILSNEEASKELIARSNPSVDELIENLHKHHHVVIEMGHNPNGEKNNDKNNRDCRKKNK